MAKKNVIENTGEKHIIIQMLEEIGKKSYDDLKNEFFNKFKNFKDPINQKAFINSTINDLESYLQTVQVFDESYPDRIQEIIKEIPSSDLNNDNLTGLLGLQQFARLQVNTLISNARQFLEFLKLYKEELFGNINANQSKIKWNLKTKTNPDGYEKISLIELIIALIQSKAIISNTDKEIIEAFSNLFNLDLSNFYQDKKKLSNREQRLKFLDTLSEKYNTWYIEQLKK